MSNQDKFVDANHVDEGPYTSSHNGEQALNAAIIQANISESFEEYLEIFDAFYADDVEVRDETREEPIRGKSKVRSLLLNLLLPLHVMAEVGGLSVSIHETSIPGYRKRNAFGLDATAEGTLRFEFHSELVRRPQVERVARRVRTSL